MLSLLHRPARGRELSRDHIIYIYIIYIYFSPLSVSDVHAKITRRRRWGGREVFSTTATKSNNRNNELHILRCSAPPPIPRTHIIYSQRATSINPLLSATEHGHIVRICNIIYFVHIYIYVYTTHAHSLTRVYYVIVSTYIYLYYVQCTCVRVYISYGKRCEKFKMQK